MIYLVAVLVAVILVLAWVSRNLLKKNEKQEDVLVSYMEYLSNISKIIELSDTKLKEVDDKGAFESDDEVGFFFKQISEIQKLLNEFKVIEIK